MARRDRPTLADTSMKLSGGFRKKAWIAVICGIAGFWTAWPLYGSTQK